jgi:hypothetical protein
MFFANGSMLVTSWSVDAHGASATFTDSVGDSVGTRDCVPGMPNYLVCISGEGGYTDLSAHLHMAMP